MDWYDEVLRSHLSHDHACESLGAGDEGPRLEALHRLEHLGAADGRARAGHSHGRPV